MKYKYVIILLLQLVCLGTAGCAGSFPDALCKDDHGVVQHGECEFAWVLVNSFDYAFDHIFEIIGLMIVSFFVIGFGISLIANGHKFWGWLLLIGGGIFIAVVYTMCLILLLFVVAFAINGFRK